MKKAIILLVSVVLTTSCATIVSGSKQLVKFDSSPSAATIYIDQSEVGKTPFETKLRRDTEHKVAIKLEGYKTFEIDLKRKTNGWVWGNIVFGGIVGLVVDLSTGAIYRLTPEDVRAGLEKKYAYKDDKKAIYVVAALEVDTTLEKVGQLER